MCLRSVWLCLLSSFFFHTIGCPIESLSASLHKQAPSIRYLPHLCWIGHGGKIFGPRAAEAGAKVIFGEDIFGQDRLSGLKGDATSLANRSLWCTACGHLSPKSSMSHPSLSIFQSASLQQQAPSIKSSMRSCCQGHKPWLRSFQVIGALALCIDIPCPDSIFNHSRPCPDSIFNHSRPVDLSLSAAANLCPKPSGAATAR